MKIKDFKSICQNSYIDCNHETEDRKCLYYFEDAKGSGCVVKDFNGAFPYLDDYKGPHIKEEDDIEEPKT